MKKTIIKLLPFLYYLLKSFIDFNETQKKEKKTDVQNP